MFPAWRLQLRAARTALADGRWDEAAEMLARPALREFLPAKRLSHELAEKLLGRARQRLESGESAAGWRDFKQAAQLGADEAALGQFRRQQAEEGLERAVELLAHGEPSGARRELERMDQRNLGGNDRRTWTMIAGQMDNADQRARKGDFAAAIDLLEHAQGLLPSAGADSVARSLRTRVTQLRGHAARLRELDGQLLSALAASDWTAVLAAADGLLELAPQHSAARQARQKAWNAVGMELTQAYRPMGADRAALVRWQQNHPASPLAASTRARARSGKEDTVTDERKNSRRLVAWIDAVGGYLICLGDEIVIGQPSASGGVDVPILADLSRRHATIRREGEAYVLTPLQKTTVDGLAITAPVVLRDKCTIKLNNAVEMRFRKPHALSATAVLEITSHHKTDPAVDGIVLMSESCILGHEPHAHVRCRSWTSDLVLFRRGEEIMCRTQAPVEIDGETCASQASLRPRCRIEGDQFSLSIEEV